MDLNAIKVYVLYQIIKLYATKTIMYCHLTFSSIIECVMIDLFLTNLDRFLIITGRPLAKTLHFTGLLLDCLYALCLVEKMDLF